MPSVHPSTAAPLSLQDKSCSAEQRVLTVLTGGADVQRWGATSRRNAVHTLSALGVPGGRNGIVRRTACSRQSPTVPAGWASHSVPPCHHLLSHAPTTVPTGTDASETHPSSREQCLLLLGESPVLRPQSWLSGQRHFLTLKNPVIDSKGRATTQCRLPCAHM